MVRISKKKPPPKSIEINSNPIDPSSSSKILHVVRQALLNAAEELVSQQQKDSNDHQFNPFQALNINNNDLNKSQQRNENAKKKQKKKLKRK
jgi:hypothetical protein